MADLSAKDALAELFALANDTVSGWDLGPSQAPGPIGWLPTFVNDFEIEDDAATFGLAGFHLTVDDADGLREGRDRRTNASPATHAPTILGVWTRQGAPGHTVASPDVFLEPVHGSTGVEFGRGGTGTRLDRKVYIPNVKGLRLGPSLQWWGGRKKTGSERQPRCSRISNRALLTSGQALTGSTMTHLYPTSMTRAGTHLRTTDSSITASRDRTLSVSFWAANVSLGCTLLTHTLPREKLLFPRHVSGLALPKGQTRKAMFLSSSGAKNCPGSCTRDRNIFWQQEQQFHW